MDQSASEVADPVIDEISELVDQTLTSDHLSTLRKALVKLSEALGSRYSVGLNVTLDIFDQQQAGSCWTPTFARIVSMARFQWQSPSVTSVASRSIPNW